MPTPGDVSKAVFLGSKALGLKIFECLFNSTPHLHWTIVHPCDEADERSNLGEFAAFASEKGVEFRKVSSAKAAKELLGELQPDIGFVCGWYWLLDVDTFTPIKRGLWGMHNSLLPKYRGSSPLVWSIANGEEFVGSTVFQISEGMDDGDILCQVKLPLDETHSIADVLAAIEGEIVTLLPQKWHALISGSATLAKQDESEATYCGQRIEADGLIDWSKSAGTIHNFVRAQAPPYPGAFTFLRSAKVKVLKTSNVPGVYFGTPGQVLRRGEKSVLVACGDNTALDVLNVSIGSEQEVAPRIIKSIRDRLTIAPVTELQPVRR